MKKILLIMVILALAGCISDAKKGDNYIIQDVNQTDINQFISYGSGPTCDNNADCVITGRINAPNQDQNINDINASGIIDANTLRVTPKSSVSNSTSVGGAIRLTNTNNNGAGLIIYSNNGASQNGRLLNIRSDNNANSQAALHIDYNGTANALEVVHTGQDATAQAFNVVSNNLLDSAFTVTSNVTSRAVSKIVHSGYPGDSSSSGQTVDLQGDGTQAQGLYVDSTATSGTTGNLLRLRNRSIDQFIVDKNGNLNTIGNIQTDLNLIVDGNILGRVDQNHVVGIPNLTQGANNFIYWGLNFIANGATNGFALGIPGNYWAFCVISGWSCTNSGMFFSSGTPRGISLQFSNVIGAFFGGGSANTMGAFYTAPRTSDLTVGAGATFPGVMQVKSTDTNRLEINYGTQATPDFREVGSELTDPFHSAGSATFDTTMYGTTFGVGSDGTISCDTQCNNMDGNWDASYDWSCVAAIQDSGVRLGCSQVTGAGKPISCMCKN